MLRKIFFVCALLLACAVLYGTKARDANAQANSSRVVGDNLAVSNGQLYQLVYGVGWQPLNSPIAPDQIERAWAPGRGQLLVVISMSGEGYASDGPGTAWVSYGAAPSGAPVNSRSQSWGQVKARYR